LELTCNFRWGIIVYELLITVSFVIYKKFRRGCLKKSRGYESSFRKFRVSILKVS